MKNAIRKMRSFAVVGAAVIGLGACAGAGEKTGEVIDDSVITTKVRTALVAEKGIDSTGISIETTKGHVMLTGHVKSAEQRSRAERIAREMAGVSAVSNRIEVR